MCHIIRLRVKVFDFLKSESYKPITTVCTVVRNCGGQKWFQVEDVIISLNIPFSLLGIGVAVGLGNTVMMFAVAMAFSAGVVVLQINWTQHYSSRSKTRLSARVVRNCAR